MCSVFSVFSKHIQLIHFSSVCLSNSHNLLQDALFLQTLHVNLSTLPCWRWEVEARAGAGVAALGSLWLWRRRRNRIQSLAVGGLVHWVGSSSSICSLLAATTLGVIVPDRDEKRGEEGVEDDIGVERRGEVQNMEHKVRKVENKYRGICKSGEVEF